MTPTYGWCGWRLGAGQVLEDALSKLVAEFGVSFTIKLQTGAGQVGAGRFAILLPNFFEKPGT